jgi:hypothetical protein
LDGLAAAQVIEKVLHWNSPMSMEIRESGEPDFLLPESLTRPLWKSLLNNLRDRYFAEKLPPLQISSRPVNVGMLIGDIVSLPWYRTVFTNLGNVIAPETLPPLELKSLPMDVGELVSDQIGHMWWTSLLRNLADRLAPERLPALQLTSAPEEATLRSGSMQLMRWSSLISLPRVPLAERQYFTAAPARVSVPRLAASPVPVAFAGVSASLLDAATPAHVHHGKLRSALSRSRLREGLLISVALLEVLYLVASMFGLS